MMDKDKYKSLLIWIPIEKYKNIKDFSQTVGVSMNQLFVNSTVDKVESKNKTSVVSDILRLRKELKDKLEMKDD